MQDSNIGTGSGPGQVDPVKFRELAKSWGTLPEKERAKAMLELTQNMPPKYKALIEDYFKKQAENTSTKP